MEARDTAHPPGLSMQMQQLPAHPPPPSVIAQQQASLGSFYHSLHGGSGFMSQQQLVHQQRPHAQQPAHQQTHQLHQQQQQQPPPPHHHSQQQQQQFQHQQQQQQQRLQSGSGFSNQLFPQMINPPAPLRHNPNSNPSPDLSPNLNTNPNSNPNPNSNSSTTLNQSIYPPDTAPHMITHSFNTSSSPPSGMGMGTGLSTAIVLSRVDPVKRKRGRPRKYTMDANGTPLPQSSPASHSKKASRGSAKKSNVSNYGVSSQGFTPHILTIEMGEDVTSKIMTFLQQGPWAVCVLSASGAVSSASLRHAGVSSNPVMYEEHFEILSLSGLFLLSEIGGIQQRTGGLSVSLVGQDGKVIGGKVGGLLMAASPVQVVLGTFFQESHKNQFRTGMTEGKEPDNSEGKELPLSLAEHDPSASMQDQTSNSVEGTDREHAGDVMPLQSVDWGGSHFDLETSSHNEQI
ncbi:hypothetical protein KP509_21G009800 [Ceratopteris richardii]|uniref:AT-hook motif nuclear-localized protein n=1 Tax=Ceratopteris richardii TaxID=49495 RepID=A0A8T2S9D6_CERRI|nr:hypothetical protein KP509_21G009800 [Ceratopteris richardii]